MPTSPPTPVAPQPLATGSTETYAPAARANDATMHEQPIYAHATLSANSKSASAQPADSDSGCSANDMASAFAHALASAFGLGDGDWQLVPYDRVNSLTAEAQSQPTTSSELAPSSSAC